MINSFSSEELGLFFIDLIGQLALIHLVSQCQSLSKFQPGRPARRPVAFCLLGGVRRPVLPRAHRRRRDRVLLARRR